MDLQSVIERLQQRVQGVRAIGGSADLAAATAGTVSVPALFVMPMSDAAAVIPCTGVVRQKVVVQWSVISVMTNRRDTTGAAALVDLAGLRRQVRTAMVGWVPDVDTGEPVHTTGGRLLNLDGAGRLWWGDEFALATYFSATTD